MIDANRKLSDLKREHCLDESIDKSDLIYHAVLSLFSPVSDIINDIFSDSIFPSISGYSDSSSINLNTGFVVSVTDTIINH